MHTLTPLPSVPAPSVPPQSVPPAAGGAHWCVVLTALAAAIALAPWLLAQDASDVHGSANGQKPNLQREGTQLQDERGRFLTVGVRLTFVSAGGKRYVGLENLNLQRVGKIIATSADSVEWFVSGTVTEYQGMNYLLIARARRKASLPGDRRSF